MGWVIDPEPIIKTVYMITYPNGKIYIGKDLSETSASSGVLIHNG